MADEEEELVHSQNAARLLGTRVPKHTVHSNNSSIRALARFIIEPRFSDYFEGEPHLRSYYANDPKEKSRFEVQKLRELLFENCNPGEDISIEGVTRIRHHLIEFVANYTKMHKEEPEPVSPESMMTYIRGIQRTFEDWEYKINICTDPFFKDKKFGLRAVLDNKFAEQQAKGAGSKQKNTLSKENVFTILNSFTCNPNHADGFLNRLILVVGIALGVRPTEMVHMTMDQFKIDMKLRDMDVILYEGKVGAIDGTAKGNRGGIRNLGYKTKVITVWNNPAEDCIVNVYKLLYKYIDLRRRKQWKTSRFWLQTVKDATTFDNFFKPQHLGRDSFSKRVRNMGTLNGIKGEGVLEGITRHSLRATMIQFLLDAGHSEAAIAKRTGHRDINSIKSYNHLRGAEGIMQQESIFQHALGSSSSEGKRGLAVSRALEKNTKRSKKDSQNPLEDANNSLQSVLEQVQNMETSPGTTLNITINTGDVVYRKDSK